MTRWPDVESCWRPSEPTASGCCACDMRRRSVTPVTRVTAVTGVTDTAIPGVSRHCRHNRHQRHARHWRHEFETIREVPVWHIFNSAENASTKLQFVMATNPTARSGCRHGLSTVPKEVPKRGIQQYVMAEAERLEKRFRTGIDQSENTRFEDYANRWLDTHGQRRYKASTREGYRRMLEAVYPTIGGLAVVQDSANGAGGAVRGTAPASRPQRQNDVGEHRT